MMAKPKMKPEPSEAAVEALTSQPGMFGSKLPMLRELGQARVILDDWLVETEGEETPEIQDLLAKLEGETAEKVQRWGLYLIDREATAAFMKAEEDFYAAEALRLKERRVAYEKHTERSRGQLQFQLESQGIGDIEGPLCTVKLQRNPAKLVGEVDAEKLAEWFASEDTTLNSFVRYNPETFELDRAAVKNAATNKLIERLPDGLELVAAQRVVVK
jgi:hypothetical protein